MTFILLTLAFLLELVAFAAFSAVAFVFTANLPLRIISFVLLLALLILFWSIFMAPRAAKKLNIVPYYCVKLVIYAISTFVLFKMMGPGVGVAFILASLLDEALLHSHNTAQ